VDRVWTAASKWQPARSIDARRRFSNRPPTHTRVRAFDIVLRPQRWPRRWPQRRRCPRRWRWPRRWPRPRSRRSPCPRRWPVLRTECTKSPVWLREAFAFASDAHVRLAAHVPGARRPGRALRPALIPRPGPFARLSHASDAPNGPVQARGTVGRSDVCISCNSVRALAAERSEAGRRWPSARRPAGGPESPGC
jgi:hypothetical protein